MLRWLLRAVWPKWMPTADYEPVINDKTNYELLQKALKAGQINFLTFIQESNYFIAARRDYIDTLYEYNLTLSRHNRYN